MHVARLSSDYTGVQQHYHKVLTGHSREAPAVFKWGDLYFMLSSGCTGWDPNRAEVHWSRLVTPIITCLS